MATTLASLRAAFSDAQAAGSITGSDVQALIDFMSGSIGTNPAASGFWQDGNEGFMDNAPGVVGTLAPSLVASLTAFFSPPRVCLGRVVMPRAGTLHDLSIYVGVQSAGNISVAIYDCGDLTPGTYTRVDTSGAIACTSLTANAWNIIRDPALTVYQGQQFMFALSCDSTTPTFGNKGTATPGTLPANFAPNIGGMLAKLVALSTAGTPHPCPATITEANMSTTNTLFSIIGRIV